MDVISQLVNSPETVPVSGMYFLSGSNHYGYLDYLGSFRCTYRAWPLGLSNQLADYLASAHGATGFEL